MAALDMTFIFTIVGLFVILSPGLLLTLPALSQTAAIDKGYAYGGTLDTDPATGFCAAATFSTNEVCKKHVGFWTSNETSPVAVVVHSVVFAIALIMIQKQFFLGSFLTTNAIIVLSVLFGVLSPGLVVTLPNLSKAECGKTGRGVADTVSSVVTYCNNIATITSANENCHKCISVGGSGFTSPVAIIVHAILFGVIAAFLVNNYLSEEVSA